MMDVFDARDYKTYLRQKVKERGRSRNSFTLKRLSREVGMQYTRLSRALRDESTHLTEDHLFSVCQRLELFPEEIEFVFLLRQIATSADPRRRDYLEQRASRLRRSRQLTAGVQEFNSREIAREMAYLFDPLCLLTVISLTVPEIREEPRRLCAHLGITPGRLNRLLKKLAELGFIRMNESKVEEVLRPKFHFGPDHPMMRAHQELFRPVCATRMQRLDEAERTSLMVTFSCDDETVAQVRARFNEFLRETEKLVSKASAKKSYQLCFDLFPWW
jgi:uncharacterized protein (TIGR02147 family)